MITPNNKMNSDCVKERNKKFIDCYGDNLITPLYKFPLNFAQCSISTIELYQCRYRNLFKNKN